MTIGGQANTASGAPEQTGARSLTAASGENLGGGIYRYTIPEYNLYLPGVRR